MSGFELSYLADQDIAKIIDYTVDWWGAEQAVLYVSLLDQHFEAVGDGLMLSKAIFDPLGITLPKAHSFLLEA
jgi:plasmid stabilization system protein ParE